MKNTQIQQRGFSILEVVAVVAVVGVLVAGGWFVYQHNHRSKVKANDSATSKTIPQQTSTSSSTSPQQTAQTTALDIPQWGVSLSLDSTTESMYYYIDPRLSDVAYLGLKAIDSIAPDCAANKFSLGAISRLTETQHKADLQDPTKGIAGTIHVGDYWYGFESPQGSCMDSNQSDAVQQALPSYGADEISKAFSSLAATN